MKRQPWPLSVRGRELAYRSAGPTLTALRLAHKRNSSPRNALYFFELLWPGFWRRGRDSNPQGKRAYRTSALPAIPARIGFEYVDAAQGFTSQQSRKCVLRAALHFASNCCLLPIVLAHAPKKNGLRPKTSQGLVLRTYLGMWSGAPSLVLGVSRACRGAPPASRHAILPAPRNWPSPSKPVAALPLVPVRSPASSSIDPAGTEENSYTLTIWSPTSAVEFLNSHREPGSLPRPRYLLPR